MIKRWEKEEPILHQLLLELCILRQQWMVARRRAYSLADEIEQFVENMHPAWEDFGNFNPRLYATEEEALIDFEPFQEAERLASEMWSQRFDSIVNYPCWDDPSQTADLFRVVASMPSHRGEE